MAPMTAPERAYLGFRSPHGGELNQALASFMSA